MKIATFRPEEKFEKFILKNMEIINLPLTGIRKRNVNLKEIIKNYEKIDYVVFTSTLGVIFFKEDLGGYYNEFMKSVKEIIAIGEKTKNEIGNFNVKVPENESTEGIVDYLKDKKGTVLVVRSAQGNENLLKNLKEHMNVINVEIYESYTLEKNERHEEFLNMLRKNEIYGMVFSSRMIVRSFFKIFYGMDKNIFDYLKNVKIVSIGEETSKELRNFGVVKFYQLKKPSMEDALDLFLKLKNKYV